MFLRKVRLSRLEFDEARQPAVYAAMRSGEPLYIGYSRDGYQRVFSCYGATTEKRTMAFKESDEIVFRFYSTAEEAKEQESDLIHRYHPRYNSQCYRCHGKYPRK